MNPYDFCFIGAKVIKLLHTTSILSKKMSPVRNNLYTKGLMLLDFIMLSGISLDGMNAYK